MSDPRIPSAFQHLSRIASRQRVTDFANDLTKALNTFSDIMPKDDCGHGCLFRLPDMCQFSIVFTLLLDGQLTYQINHARPTPKNYQDVSVFAFRWSNDDLGSENSERELLTVFARQFNFKIVTHVINDRCDELDRTNEFMDALRAFHVANAKKNCLCIYVYSGHGQMSNLAYSEYMIAGRAALDGLLVGPRMNWMPFHHLIRIQHGDQLYIFDSCFAGTLAVGHGPEVLSSSTWFTSAGANIGNSFTAILTQHLKAVNGAPISVATLHANMHRESATNLIEYPPFYAKHPDKESIVLQKLEKQQQPSDTETPQQRANREAYLAAAAAHTDRVLISVRIQSNDGMPLDANGWTTWLAINLPVSFDSTQINIEAVFGSGSSSSVVLVSMPLDLWAVIPSSMEAYNFIAHVSSSNRLLTL